MSYPHLLSLPDSFVFINTDVSISVNFCLIKRGTLRPLQNLNPRGQRFQRVDMTRQSTVGVQKRLEEQKVHTGTFIGKDRDVLYPQNNRNLNSPTSTPLWCFPYLFKCRSYECGVERRNGTRVLSR